MSASKFSIEEALGFGWKTLTSKFGTVMLYIFLPYFLISLVSHGMSWFINKSDSPIVSSIGTIAIFFVTIAQMIIVMGIMRVVLKLVDDEKPNKADFHIPFKIILRYCWVSVLVGAIVVSGILLLVIPGIIWHLQFSFSTYAVIDEKFAADSAMNALKKSSLITAGSKWKLLLFALVCVGIGLLGILCFVVGIVPAAILICLAVAHVYRQLQRNTEFAGIT